MTNGPTSPKVTPDWERIEADYRAGILSLREIASQHGITEGSIRKRAKRDEWVRDLSSKINAKADSLVRKDLVRSEVRRNSAISEKQIIDAGATAIAEVRLSHRKDISRARNLSLQLLGELEAQTEYTELFEQLGDLLRNEDDKGQDKRNDIYNKVISSAGRIDSFKKLAETLKILIGLEREAYGLNSGDDKSVDAQEQLRLMRETFARG